MEFFDCNCFVGLPAVRMLKPARDAGELLTAMDQAGIARALVWHVVQRDYYEPLGNRLIADEIRGHEDRLAGCWGMVPSRTGEAPPPERLVEEMAASNVRALRVYPGPRKFLLRGEVFGGILDLISELRIPLFLPVLEGVTWQGAYDLLREFPNLTCVITSIGDWGPDRLFWPLVENYPNVVFDMSEYTLDGGIESFVANYGAGRMLFGTGFPKFEQGGPMLAIKHAEIAEEDKAKIAGGNLARLLAWE